LRYVAEYLGLNWEDKQYTKGEDWQSDKSSWNFDFPNVPYLKTCGHLITESSAILSYLPVKGKEPKLLGGDEWDRIKVTQLLGVIGDVKSELGSICYSKKEDFETKKASGFKSIVTKLASLEKFLAKKDYLMGYLTVADFVLFYYLDLISKLDKKQIEGFHGLVALHDRVANIPQIKKYIDSGRVSKYFNSPQYAAWSGPEN